MELKKTTHFLILFLFEPRLYTLFFSKRSKHSHFVLIRVSIFFFLFFFGSMLLRNFNDESSEVISSIFIFFPIFGW